MIVEGYCSPEFLEIKKIFQYSFNKNKETGANFAVVKNNKVLINIFGGQKNSKEKWDEKTMVNTFSLSKGVYACCVAKLINEGEIDIEKNISFYWPEFKKNKNGIKVKHILSHQSGLYRFIEKVTNEDLLDFQKITKILEHQNPDHKPGEHVYYHAKTHGYLIEKLIQIITNKELKFFFKENFSSKYNLNYAFGLDQDELKNVADLDEIKFNSETKYSEFNAFNNPQHDIKFYNSTKWRVAGIASMGGHGSALSIASLYDLLSNDLKYNLNKVISSENLRKILKQSNNNLIDQSLKLPVKWTYSGYLLRGGYLFGKNKDSFGHNGWGGSVGFGDPKEGFGVCYVTKKLNNGMQINETYLKLIKKLYEIIDKSI